MIYPDTGTQYDVLLEIPERSEAGSAERKRSLSIIKSATGIRRVTDKSGVPVITRGFTWRAMGRAEIKRLRTFEAARDGRVVPFWVPTYQRDIILAQPAKKDEQNLLIKDIKYSSMVFTRGSARRHIAVLHMSGAVQLYRITAARSNANGTETVVLDKPLTADISEDTMIAYLTLCRLSDDTVEYVWDNPELVDVTFNFVEIPKEAP